MYLHYFGFVEAPFSIAPNPRYLYMGKRHQEALAHLLYGVRASGGFVLLTGDVGTGKTTICRRALEQIPADCDVAYVFNPRLTVEELLATVCTEFGIDVPSGSPSVKVFVDRINAYLLDAHARGRHTVLIIDEAQNLSADVLEQMRLLTNLETNEKKLLQIILLGQPELAELLARPGLRQLAQRIVARFHLGPLDKGEIGAYVRHRLEVAGIPAGRRELFPARLDGALFRYTQGVPRLLNILCDRALLGAYAEGKSQVDATTLRHAVREVIPAGRTQRRRIAAAAVATILLAGLIGAGVTWIHGDGKVAAEAERSPAPPASMAARANAQLSSEAELKRSLTENGNEVAAYDALFQAWGIAARGLRTCARLDLDGIYCRTGRGSLRELRMLNRPAVLTLSNAGGVRREAYATLVGLNKAMATVVIGDATLRVDPIVLAELWSGQYALIWRKPAEAQGYLKAGEAGSAVVWLERQLALGEKSKLPPRQDPVFDDGLMLRLKRFQLDRDLEPDGTLGWKTMAHLASMGDPTAPALAVPGEE